MHVVVIKSGRAFSCWDVCHCDGLSSCKHCDVILKSHDMILKKVNHF